MFSDLDACVTPVLSPHEAVNHSHNKDRGVFITSSSEEFQAAPAPRLSRSPGITQPRPLPDVGSNTRDILLEHGFSESDFTTLIRDGVISSSKL